MMIAEASAGCAGSGATLLDSVQSAQDLAEFSHFRRELSLPHRPLEPVALYPDAPTAVTAESLRAWEGSPAYAAAEAFFTQYPERSLCQRIDRMLLHHLVRALRPEHVVEVGTFFAAGSEVIARGLWENGTGLLHTIDPYGKIRCPALIARWAEPLRRHVRFYPWNSMEFFQQLGEKGTALDLAFIDGNHDFEFALFDLQAAARLMRPGGIVIMDDANQSGPFWAAKVFLEQSPGWSEIGECLRHADARDPFGPLPAFFPESKFLILQSQKDVTVGRVPFTTGQIAFRGRQLHGIELMLASGQRGDLLGRVFLRAFPTGEIPQQVVRPFHATLEGEPQCRIAFETAVETRYAANPILPKQTTEVVLLWRPAEAGQPLRLLGNPQPIGSPE